MEPRIPSMVLAVFLFGTAAQAWNLSPCSGIAAARRARYCERLVNARPGDPDYVPKPFPASNADLWTDFVFQLQHLQDLHREGKSHRAGRMPPLDDNLLRLIKENRVSIEVAEVESWTQPRCLGPRNGDRRHLIRVFDSRSRAEIARVAMQDSGLLDEWAYREPGVNPGWWLIPIQRPDSLAGEVSRIVGEHMVDAQYVETWGTFECDALLPCVAMRSSETETVFVADARGGIASFGPKSRRLSRKGDLETFEKRDALTRTLTKSQRIMSLGGNVWVVVEKVR